MLSQNFEIYGGQAESHVLNSKGSLGYTWPLPIGLQIARLQLSSTYSVKLSYLDYDREVVRPLDNRVRANYQSFLYGDVIGARLAFDTRDVPQNPISCLILSQLFTLGGLLPTDLNNYYLISRSRFDFYLPIIDSPVADNWNFTLGFSFHTGFSVLLQHPFKPTELNVRENGIAISSFTIGRGWEPAFGELLWESSFTVAWLLVRQIINLELFFDVIGLWRDKNHFLKSRIDDYRFALGFGPRLTLPQLPIGIYLVKLFRFEEGRLNAVPEIGIGDGWAVSINFKLDTY